MNTIDIIKKTFVTVRVESQRFSLTLGIKADTASSAMAWIIMSIH